MPITSALMKIYSFLALTALVAFSMLLFGTSSASSEEYLKDQNITIQRHDKRNSKIKFTDSRDKEGDILWGMLFDSSIWQTPSQEEARVESYEKLPRCEQSTVVMYELRSERTKLSDKQDIIFYDGETREQKSKAKKFPGIAVAYQPALIRDPRTDDLPPAQVFARFIRIKCLPTRFRFIEIGSKRYAEFRTGSEAWSGD